MYFPFKVSKNLTALKIKSGEEFRIEEFLVSINSIPDEWMVQLFEDKIIIGRKDSKYTSLLEIKTMLIIASAIQKKINFGNFMNHLGLRT